MKKLVIGVTGGVGAGKSSVMQQLKNEYKAHIIEADRTGHRLEQQGQPGYTAVVSEFGDGILSGNGEIDRGRLSDLVFQDEKKLRRLNEILHPMIYADIQAQIERESQMASETTAGEAICLFALEAAILFETGFNRCCDYTVYVSANEDTRIRRLKESRGYSAEKARSVIANQLADSEFRRLADYVIENDRDFADTEKQVRNMMEGVLWKYRHGGNCWNHMTWRLTS